jgi:hypothetical protein
MSSFLSFRKNINSQNGEDGIIEQIFKMINVQNGNFIEFGAWDGKHLSNTLKLFHEGWSGIFIEGDNEKFQTLINNFKNNKNISCINKFVGYTNDDSLDTIIQDSSFKNKIFDFISIDVDGLDYFIFEKMNKYLPKVVCIEVSSGHSPTFPTLLNDNIAKNNVGQSIEIITRMSSQKGYFPLCYTGNLFLIKNDYKNIFKDYIKSNEEIYREFLEHIVGPDQELMKYLYELYCSPNVNERHNRQTQTFGYIFPENYIMKEFCESRLNHLQNRYHLQNQHKYGKYSRRY